MLNLVVFEVHEKHPSWAAGTSPFSMTEIHRRTNPKRPHFPASYVSWSRSGIPKSWKTLAHQVEWVLSMSSMFCLQNHRVSRHGPAFRDPWRFSHGFLCGKWKMNQEKSSKSNHRNLRKKIQPNHWSNGKSNSPMLVGGSCPPPSCCDPLSS